MMHSSRPEPPLPMQIASKVVTGGRLAVPPLEGLPGPDTPQVPTPGASATPPLPLPPPAKALHSATAARCPYVPS